MQVEIRDSSRLICPNEVGEGISMLEIAAVPSIIVVD
jgi:hypothetical protein